MATKCCTFDPTCENEGSYRYQWAWGEEGTCCEMHRAAVDTLSGQLGRSVFVEPLTSRGGHQPAPALDEPKALEIAMARIRELLTIVEQQRTLINDQAKTIAELQSELGSSPTAGLAGGGAESVIEGR
jgi:hypothetical protein